MVLLLLSGCVGGVGGDAPPARGFTLDGGGIAPDGTSLRVDFGRAQEGVIATVSRLVGRAPTDVSVNGDCDDARLTAVRWGDDLVLNFQRGAFAGWSTTHPGFPVAGGFRVGLPQSSLPPVTLTQTALGTQFSSGRIDGLLAGSEVALLTSGEACVFG